MPPPKYLDARSPADWSATVDYDAWRDRYSIEDAIAIHHGGGGDYPAGQPDAGPGVESAQLRTWERYHLSRGWRGLAYGWAFGQSGTCYRIRGWNHYAAHRGDVDADGISNNSEVIPALFILSGNRHPPTDALIRRFEDWRRWVETVAPYPAPGRRLYGHKNLTATICPGPLVMPYVVSNRYLSDPDPNPDWTRDLIMALPTIRRGDGFKAGGRSHLKADVKRGQGLLLAAGFKDQNTSTPETATDGLFGRGTETAATAFQAATAGLTADGVIGKNTWRALLGES